MYKFEISADSPEELREKMRDFASDIMMQDTQTELPKYVDEVPTFVEPMMSPTAVIPEPLIPVVPTAMVTMRSDQSTLDAAGQPYNAAIHSAKKTKTPSGLWRAKRGGIEAPTLSVAPAAVNVPVVPPTTVKVAMPSFQAVAPVVVEPTPAYENIVVPDGGRPAHSLITFKNNLMLIIAGLINEGKITQEYIAQLKTYFQVKEIWNIIGSEKQSTELFDVFCNAGFLTKVD